MLRKKQYPSLQSINLSENPINAKALSALMEGLIVAKTILACTRSRTHVFIHTHSRAGVLDDIPADTELRQSIRALCDIHKKQREEAKVRLQS